MTKKIGIKKIETNIPSDSFISSIDGIAGAVKGVTLDVYFTSKKIYELEDTMFVVFDMYDSNSTGKMKALLVGNRDKDFTSLMNKLTNLWPDYSYYYYDTDFCKIYYPLQASKKAAEN